MPRYTYKGLNSAGTAAVMITTAGAFLGTIELFLWRRFRKGPATESDFDETKIDTFEGYDVTMTRDHPASENAKDSKKNLVEWAKAREALRRRTAQR